VTAKKLRAIGMSGCSMLRSADEERLRGRGGKLALWLKTLSRGEDPRPVEARPAAQIALR